MRLLHTVAFSKKLRWLSQTKVISLKTQPHAVNACAKRSSQRSLRLRCLAIKISHELGCSRNNGLHLFSVFYVTQPSNNDNIVFVLILKSKICTKNVNWNLYLLYMTSSIINFLDPLKIDVQKLTLKPQTAKKWTWQNILYIKK